MPYTNSLKRKNCVLLMDEARSHYTPDIKRYLEENLCRPIYITGGYTACCQPLDVSVNKPIKAYYGDQYEKWQSNKDCADFQPGSGNRKRPSYESMANWVSECLSKIEPDSIKLSFSVCGMCYADANMNALSFVSALNGRLKTVLFVNRDRIIFEQFMCLCFILSNKFTDRSMLLNKIQEYIITYKPRFRMGFAERYEVDDRNRF